MTNAKKFTIFLMRKLQTLKVANVKNHCVISPAHGIADWSQLQRLQRLQWLQLTWKLAPVHVKIGCHCH